MGSPMPAICPASGGIGATGWSIAAGGSGAPVIPSGPIASVGMKGVSPGYCT